MTHSFRYPIPQDDPVGAALAAQQNRLLEGLGAINEERTRRGMLPTIMYKVLSPELGVFNEPIRRGK